jgi:hypothetical protein
LSRLAASLQRTSIQGIGDITQMLSICNLAIDDYILKKSGEKSLNFKVNKPYTSNSASNSSWIPSHSKMTLFNHTNQPYHILNPLIKTTSYIKDDIIIINFWGIVAEKNINF